MKKVKYTRYVPKDLDRPDYQILRVPPNVDSFLTAYEMIKTATDREYPKEDFNEFYNHTDTIYMVQSDAKARYMGAGWISHDRYSYVPYKFRGEEVYVMQLAFFYCDLPYSAIYDWIKTIIKDKNDRIIFATNFNKDETPKVLIDAYRNNRFKWLDDHTLYHLPDVIEGMNKEDLLQKVDPEKMDDKVVDRYARMTCNCPDVAAAQEQYMKDLKAKAASELPYATSGCICPCEEEDIFVTGCDWEETSTCTCTCNDE